MRSKMSRGKLTDQEVRAIRKAKGTLEELGKLFGMTKSSIQRIKKGQSYAGVK